MKSIQVYTEEIDDLGLAMSELKSQVEEHIEEQGELCKNTCAIVFCDYDVDTDELTSALMATFEFPFIGCTGRGLINENPGFSDTGIVMMILTADDVEFSLGISEEVSSQNDTYMLEDCYSSLSGKLEADPKLCFVLAGYAPQLVPDDIVRTISKKAIDVPLFGGVASDAFDFKKLKVFYNDHTSANSVVMLLIGGNIRPIMEAEFSLSLVSEFKHKVTSAEGTRVHTLDEHRVNESLSDIGMKYSYTDAFRYFMATPFLITEELSSGDRIEKIRAIRYVNEEDGSADFLGKIEKGNMAQMVLITRESIEESVKLKFDEIFDRIQKSEDYKYSVILCMSCAARYSLIVADKMTEARGFLGRVPNGVHIAGFYTYGEFCPLKGLKTDKTYNKSTNETLAILAL